MAGTSKMKAKKPSKVVKPKKNTRRSTVAVKNHRFQSFSERISKLKIDPIRRRRNGEERDALSEETATYFGRSLEQWKDSNMTHNFSTFAKEVSPLCDSLPMVLHNEEKIMSLLVKHIEEGDGLSLEPLLDLLSHFAHDLDTRFEKHLAQAVTTVTAVAARHADPAVVEWSFGCLAWLFKYLSRLLAPDLRPLYDLMAPYLGKKSQKPYIIRFAAESLSFLIRKAAASYEKDPTPLKLIIGHIFDDCLDSKSSSGSDLHCQGVMTLLTDAIKGVQRGTHSSGLSILSCMLQQAATQTETNSIVVTDMITGTLTSLIHHTDSETFAPIQQTITEAINSISAETRPQAIAFSSELIFTIAAVRKGTRISDWSSLISILRNFIVMGRDSTDLESNVRSSILKALVVTIQAATIDAALPNLDIFEIIWTAEWTPQFLAFCDLFARLGRERFDNFLRPQFQKFFLDQWQEYGDSALMLVPRLAKRKQQFSCSPGFQNSLTARLEALNDFPAIEGDMEILASANTVLNALPHLKIQDDVRRSICDQLSMHIKTSLVATSHRSSASCDLAPGAGLASLLESCDEGQLPSELLPLMFTESRRFQTLPRFWANLLQLLKKSKSAAEKFEETDMVEFEATLVNCLSMPSHEIRQAALDIMQLLYQFRGKPVPELLLTAITIESTPISLETTRSFSMNIRKLASGYSGTTVDLLMQKAMPSYCFGLLHIQLAQAWDDAIKALADMSKAASGEEVITDLAQRWMEGVPTGDDASGANHASVPLDIDSHTVQVASDFECSNLAKVSDIANQVFESPHSGYPSSDEQLRLDHARISPISQTARGQALKVLNQMSSLAEKKSRMLVPVLLRWVGAAERRGDDDDAAESSRWSRKDQKAMLAVFAHFTNPRVLFKTGDVYDALLNLCANGDVEIQQSALKAIFAWKNQGVNRYEENLTNILDEARFREEVSVFLHNEGQEEGSIRDEDHANLMPVLLRLLYGRAVAGGKHGQGSRRKAIFVALSRFDENVLGMFVDVALGSLGTAAATNAKIADGDAIGNIKMPLRQQFGMLNMLEDMLETLGSSLEPFGAKIVDCILLCTVAAARRLEKNELSAEAKDASLLRSIRQTGMQCLVKVYSSMKTLDLSAQAKIVVDELISPRLETFAAENTQSISGTLRLLSAWSASVSTAGYLVNIRKDILEHVARLLRAPSAKDEVRLFILQNILDNVLQDDMGALLNEEHATSFVQSIGEVLNQQISKELLDACVASLTRLVSLVNNEDEATNIIAVCAGLLTKPSKIVSPRTKAGLLQTMLPLIDNFETSADDSLYDALCGLSSRLADPDARSLLSTVLCSLCRSDMVLLESAQICADLNALGSSRLDEADHERREHGFTKIYEKHDTLALQQWQPIVHNCLFYIRDNDDLVNRSSASRALERFLDAGSRSSEDFKPLIMSALIPGIEYGVKSSSELVRAEYLRVLGHLVERFPDWPAVGDMKTLTVSGDEEASVFINVLHIQQHRRLRALRRLSDEATHLNSSNRTRVFLPLLEHFVFDPAEGDAGRTLADQTILTIGALAKALNWSAFRATFKRYTGYLNTKVDHEKPILRLQGVLVDALNAEIQAAAETDSPRVRTNRSQVITEDFLPPLTAYIHHKDESTVDRRMPVAVTIVKLLKLLPEPELSSRLPPVLTDISHVLRSRSQEARDQARKTLASILALIGPSYFGFISKELRTALQRGYQLHVLSFTVHSLLVNVIDTYQPGDLDHCLPDLTSIIMDDIFGVTGQEKDAEEYKSGMKEVKSSKSFDTMELLARVTLIPRLGLLIRPLRALLSERLDSKMLKKIDELLIRLRRGIDHNPAAESRDMLIFCHEVIQQVHAEQHAAPAKSKALEYKTNRYLIQMEVSNKSGVRGTTTSQTFKLVSFALNLLRKVLRRHEDLQTPSNLTGFLPIAGDALVQGQGEVQLSAVKLLSTIMKVPIADLETNAPVYAKEAVRLIQAATSLTTDSAKAALELLTAVMREKRSVPIRDKDIAEVLKALKDDIDEPDRQSIIYKFLRAVLGRKIMITEVYELMDQVGKVLVTNPDRNIRESARSAYLHFVMDYPQGKDRWNKQAAFFVENLKYERPAGRQSVMELLHQLLAKIGEDVLAQLSFTIFVALVPIQVSDPDQSCCQMAGALIGRLFERANDEQLNTFVALMEKWLKNESNATIQVASLQCWMVLLRARTPPVKQLEGLRDTIEDLLDFEDVVENREEQRLVRNALQAFEVIVEANHGMAFAKRSAPIWSGMQTCLSVPDMETKELTSRLIGALFSNVASASSKSSPGLSALPLRGSEGFDLKAGNMRQICHASLRALRARSDQLTEALAAQTIRNLVFLGRCFAVNGMTWRDDAGSPSDEEDEVGAPQKDPSAIANLFNRLSYIIRQDSLSALSRTAAIQTQAALLPHVSSVPNLQSILRPLYSLTDPSIPQPSGEAHKSLIDKARELLDLVQKKVGTEAYISALGAARAEMKGRRDERKQKRRIEAVSAPEKWARDKRKKYEGKKMKIKAKGMEARGQRRGW